MLSIRNLKTYFRTPKGLARAVDGVSLDIGPGEVVGVVGDPMRQVGRRRSARAAACLFSGGKSFQRSGPPEIQAR
jgi:ABC-type antimicrobial peptide transport system ATPase subunit